MQRFTHTALAVALGLTVVAPLPLLAQYRATVAVGPTTVARDRESQLPVESHRELSPRPWPGADSTARKLSLGRHMLIGAGVGAAAGYGIGVYSRNHSSDCNDCFCCPSWTIPVFGAVAGAAVGTVIGWLTYLARMSPPAP